MVPYRQSSSCWLNSGNQSLQKINDAVRITLVYLAQFPTNNWWVANAHFMSLVMTTRAVVWLAFVYITWRFCSFSWCVLVMCIYVHIPETFLWLRYTPLTSRAAFCTSQKKQPRILSGYIFGKIFIVLEILVHHAECYCLLRHALAVLVSKLLNCLSCILRWWKKGSLFYVFE